METHRKRALAETAAFASLITSGLWLSVVASVPAMVLVGAGVVMFLLAFRETCVIEKIDLSAAGGETSDKAFGRAFVVLILVSLVSIGIFAWVTTALPIPGSVQLP